MSAEAHAEGVARVRAALASVGLSVGDELTLDHPDAAFSRLTFGDGPGGGVGFVVVTTGARESSRVIDGSFEWLYGYDGTTTVTFEADLGADPHADLGAATNAEVARVLAFRSSVSEGVLEGVVPPDAVGRVASLVDGLAEPESASRANVLLALEVADLVESGVPLEWALRRVGSAEWAGA